MTVTTPLGPDVLLLVGFSGHEGISQLFSFELDLAAQDQTKVVFDKLLGHKVTINLTVPGGQKRHFSGICTSLTQGMRGIDHTSFQMEISPHLWLLTLRSRSRIFQNMSVPEILKKVLDIPDVVYELEGTFHPRTYCVQYRETDFHFASRLMEEEGIYYFFKHKADSHQMVVSNKEAFPELQPGELILQQAEGTHVQEERITRWQKQQQLRSVKVTLRDHHFQMPQKSLEAIQEIQDDVKVGKVTHKLRIGESDALEVYDWPGEYAHRFDAIDRGGADRPDELQKLLKDNERTAKIRMEQEAAESIAIQGVSRYRHLVSGHTFTLKEQVVVPYDGSSSHDGKYVLTSVNHSGRMSGSYRSGDAQEVFYDNSFTCIPAALHYRPQRTTPRPVITGTQTAVVVGPKGEQIHTDKHGRVKVQFHWDREGKHDAASSCWIRVTQAWADSGFGAICLPRAGQEVVVAFEEGDPDRPLILGSVYNADNPPPFTLPENRMFSGIKTNSVHGNPSKNFSGLQFNDTKGSEHTGLYSEKDMLLNAENDHQHHVGNYQHTKIGRTSLSIVGGIPGLSGGSGGGGSSNLDTDETGQSGTTPGYANWKTSDGLMSASLGLAGGTVYGVNSQDTVGLMHQITIGQATQVCVDPLGFFGYLPTILGQTPPTLNSIMPLGGNQQLYWGTNYQSTYGPNFGYTWASQVNMQGTPGAGSIAMATMIPLLWIVYELTYGAQKERSTAQILATTFVALQEVLTGALMKFQALDQSKKFIADTAVQIQATQGLLTSLAVAGSSQTAPIIALIKTKSKAYQQMVTKQQLMGTDSVNSINYVDGALINGAHDIYLFARQTPPSDDNPSPGSTSTICIDAWGQAGTGGTVFINATDAVTLTSGVACIELSKTGIKLHAGPVVSMTLDVEKGITLNAGPINEISMDLAGNVDIETLNFTLNAKIQAAIEAFIKNVTTTISKWVASLFSHP